MPDYSTSNVLARMLMEGGPEVLRNRLMEEKVQENPWAMPAPARAEARPYAVARPADAMAPVSEMISPTMGAHGLASILAEMGHDAKAGNTTGFLDKLPMGLGIFAGARAKTANLPMLERAQGMAAKGAPREAIWKDTGWFRGPDQMWRFEIDDSGMKHAIPPVDWIPRKEGGKPLMAPNLEVAYDKAASQLTPQAPVRVKRLFDHPELEATYRHGFANSQDHPGITGMPVQLMEGPGAAGTFMGPLPYGIIGLHETLPPGSARSVALHELQHAVQAHEGFEQGSSPKRFAVSPDTLKNVMSGVETRLSEESHFANALVTAAQLDVPGFKGQTLADLRQYVHAQQLLGRLPADISGIAQKMADNVAWNRYRKSAGEVEASNVQKRMNMSRGERIETPPWTTEDVPGHQQIVR